MLPFFWYMLKVMICSGILFAYYWLFLRNKIFHHYNRFYLLASLVLSLLLPLLKINFWQPSDQENHAIRVLQAVSVGDAYMSHMVISSHQSNWSFAPFYTMMYWLVCLIFLLVMLRALLLIRTLLKQYPVQQLEDIAFVNTRHASTPFSFLKYIFWNSHIDMETTTGRQIFKHELAHIQEKHTHDKLFINIILIFCWCNPFFWLYRKELNMIHEFIADKKAVEDNDTAAFAAMILQAAYPKHQFALVNNFFYSPIKRRLLMLTKNKNPRVNYIGRIMVLPLIVLVFAAFCLKAKNGKDDAATKFNLISAVTTKSNAITLTGSLYKSMETDKMQTDTIPNKNIILLPPKGIQPIYYLDGIEVDSNIIHTLNPNDIAGIDVLKDAAAIALYGDKAKHGVIIIKTKNYQQITSGDDADPENALYVINGKVLGKGKAANSDIDKIIAEKVYVKWLKKPEAIAKYGKDGAAGACEVAFTNGEIYKFSDNINTNRTGEMNSNGDPILKLGVTGGGRIQSDYLRSVKEISLSTGYKLVSAVIYFEGPGFDKNVVQVTLNSNSLSAVSTYINRCEDDAKIVFDNVSYADPAGVIKKMTNPPVFVVGFNNTPQSKIAGKKLDVVELQKEKEKQKIKLDQQSQEINRVFIQAEQNPEYTGGPEAWRKFLQANLKVNTPVDNGAKAGIYKVVLKFIVNVDGSLSDIKCENDPGYGICAEAIRFIKTTPKWQPAVQNGRKVSAYKKQPITFVIEE